MTSLAPVALFAPGRRAVVVGVLGLMTCIAFESLAVTTALPVVAADLAAVRWYSLAFAATITTGIVGMTLGGSWADRRGVAEPLAVGGVLFLTGIGLCAAAPGIEVFVAGRLLQGAGGGIDSVVLYVLIAQLIPEQLRARMFGLLTAAWLLPSVAGPWLAGVLVETVGWRVVFAVVLTGAALAWAPLLAIARRAPARRTDTVVVGRRAIWAAAAAAGLVGLHVGGQQSDAAQLGWTALMTLAVAATAVRLLPVGTLRGRTGIPRLVALRGMFGATAAVTDVYLPLYLQHERGYPPSVAGLVVASGALGWAAGAWLQGRTTGTAGAAVGLRRAGLLLACGPAGVLVLVAFGAPVAVAVVAVVLMGTGLGAAYPRVTTAVLAASPAAEHGANSAALQLAESMASAALLAVTGAALATLVDGRYAVAYLIGTGVAAVAWRAAFTVAEGQGRRAP